MLRLNALTENAATLAIQPIFLGPAFDSAVVTSPVSKSASGVSNETTANEDDHNFYNVAASFTKSVKEDISIVSDLKDIKHNLFIVNEDDE